MVVCGCVYLFPPTPSYRIRTLTVSGRSGRRSRYLFTFEAPVPSVSDVSVDEGRVGVSSSWSFSRVPTMVYTKRNDILYQSLFVSAMGVNLIYSV